MAHQVAIAKASFAAALLRPPTSASRNEIAQFHTILDEAVLKSTSANIQKCKDWLIHHVLSSAASITAFSKYVAALSSSFGKTAQTASSGAPAALPSSKPSVRRKRLHLVYLLNDLLHHAKYHVSIPLSLAALTGNLQPQLVEIFSTTASFDSSKYPMHHQKLRDILDLWAKHGYFPQQFIDKLLETVKEAGKSVYSDKTKTNDTNGDAAATSATSAKEAPYIMPASHGDANTPYYDLPAANMLPHLVPNKPVPIRPSLMKPLQFLAGPADPALIHTVKDFLKDVEHLYDDTKNVFDEGIVVDVDQIGQPLVKDEVTGDLVPLEAYYGWSVGFCERMKKRKKRLRDGPDSDDDRQRGRSRSSSRDGSPQRTRRYSRSQDGGSRSRSRSFNRYRNRSYSRSRSPPKRRSRSPEARPTLGIPPLNRSLSGIMSASGRPLATPIDQISDPIPHVQPPPPGPMNASHFQHNFPIGPGGLPIPPPPPYHTGPWPPLPPAVPNGLSFNPASFPNYSTMSFIPPPPPPPPMGQHPHPGTHWHGPSPPQPYGPGNPPPPPPPPQHFGGWPQGQQGGQQGYHGGGQGGQRGGYGQQDSRGGYQGAGRGGGGRGQRGRGRW